MCKINCVSYRNNTESENESEKISFTILSQIIQYLEVHLTKEIKDLYTEK